MTQSLNISVAIATLNRVDGLKRCLDALMSGDLLPAEIIIVDQSGDDTTQQMLQQYQTSGVPMVYIRQKRRGLSASRNAAIARASGSVLAVTDDDCVPDRRWVAALNGAFGAHFAPDVVTGRVLPLGPEAPGVYAVSSRTSTVRAEFRGKVEPWLVGTGGNTAVKLDWVRRVGLYDERLGAGSPGGAGEDLEFLYRLLRDGARAQYEPDAIIYHERQSQARRTASRLSYGRGVGACCALLLRQGDRYALHILTQWLRLRTALMLQAAFGWQWRSSAEELLVYRGTLDGLVYGFLYAANRPRVTAFGIMEGESLVSVITTFLNPSTDYMGEAIESVLAQTYSHWELLLVDDGSTNGSTALAQEYARRFPGRVHYLEHPGHENRGMSASRNAGVAAASGDLIAFLDADDVYLPEKLTRQVEALRAQPEAAMVYSATKHWYSWTGRREDQRRDHLRNLGVAPDTLVAPPTMLERFLKFTAQTPGTCSVLIRREALECVGGFDNRFQGMFEDQVLLFKLCAAMPVFVQGGVWDYYRQHPTSCTSLARASGYSHTRRSALYEAFLRWLEDYLAHEGLGDRATRQALRRELLPYKHPWLYFASPLARRRLARLLRNAWGWATARAKRRWPHAAYALRYVLDRLSALWPKGRVWRR